MKVIRNTQIVPALMFHSVGLEKFPWVWSYISESIETFEAKLRLLKRNEFRTVFWQDVYDHMSGTKILPKNSILLTFDDGYLDNWVYVYPLLKKYGMKATVFVSSDFVDPGRDVRMVVEDVKEDKCARKNSSVAGFLNWPEITAMEQSGLIDIQSHAKTHTWYFSGPNIVDYHRPHDVTPYPWLLWNAAPERKPFYLNEDQQEFLPWGFPILEHRKSLEVRRFIPADDAVEELTQFIEDRGGRHFFDSPNWRATLARVNERNFGGDELPGRFESESEWRARIEEELSVPKDAIEHHLGKDVSFICWPGGANNEFVHNLARKIGYKSWTLSSGQEPQKRNLPGADAETIRRIGTSNRIEVKGKTCGDGGAYFQLLRVLDHQHSVLAKWLLRAYKLFALVKHYWRR